MRREYLENFIWLVIGLAILASLIGLVRYRRLPRSLRYVALLACFDMLMELTAKFTKEALHLKSNLFLFPLVSIGELVLLGLAYRQALQSVAFGRVLPWVLGAFSAYALFISFSQFATAHYAVGIATLVNLLVLGLAGLYFRKLLNELQVENLRRDPFFWLSVGLAVYGLGNLLISLFYNYLITHYSEQLQLFVLWGVRNLFNVLLYLAYCWALWIAPPKGLSEPAATRIPGRA